jgi:hypothetical protein
MCSFFENLNWKVFGTRTEMEKGMAKDKALIRAAFTYWLL